MKHMEKTYDELREELSSIEDSIKSRNIELNSLRDKAHQLHLQMDSLDYDRLVGKYFRINNGSGLYTIFLFVNSFCRCTDDTSIISLSGKTLIVTEPTMGEFRCSFYNNHCVNVCSMEQLEEITKEEYISITKAAYDRLHESLKVNS